MELRVSSEKSSLCTRLAERVGKNDAESAIEYLADSLRKAAGFGGSLVDDICSLRNVVSLEYVASDEFDGKLEPRGGNYGAGFKMFLKSGMPQTRTRFTIAHEVMHTFFYEFLPEMKFAVHRTDSEEERICNFGAAHLLLPTAEVRRALRGMPVCLGTADALCQQFQVSLPTLILRIRQLKLWDVELSTWVRLSNGTVVLDKSIGGLEAGWSWGEAEKIQCAFRGSGTGAGRTFLTRTDSKGDTKVRLMKYDLAGCGRMVRVLSGPKVIASPKNVKCLFGS